MDMLKTLVDLLLNVGKWPQPVKDALLALLLMLVLATAAVVTLCLKYKVNPLAMLGFAFRAAHLGIRDFNVNSEAHASKRFRLLQRSKEEVLYVGTVFHKTLGDTAAAVIEAAKRGVRVRFLIAAPNGKHFAANAALFGETVDDLRKEFERTIEGYERVKSALEDRKDGRVELSLLDEVFPNAFYFYDAKRTSGSLLMTIRPFKRNAPFMPSLHIVNRKAWKFLFLKGSKPPRMADIYYTDANSAWQRSQPYETWKLQQSGSAAA